MPLQPKEVQIGDRRFTLSPLPAMRAYRLSARLGKLAGPAFISAVLGGIKRDAMPSLTAFFDKLTPDELEAITCELLDGAQMIDGGKIVEVLPVFDSVFQGKLHEVLRLVREALVLNYSEAFSGLVAAASSANSKAASASS